MEREREREKRGLNTCFREHLIDDRTLVLFFFFVFFKRFVSRFLPPSFKKEKYDNVGSGEREGDKEGVE